jgi:glycerol-3-phosphate dehydrogenase
VTGGKLTTFRLIALDALKAVRHYLPDLPPLTETMPVLNPVDIALPEVAHLNEAMRRRLLGRYAADTPALLAAAQPGEFSFIPGTQILWAELRWAARAEGVVHLEDLLLRRVRLGLLLPGGGGALLPQIRAICLAELGWNDARWQREESAYLALWQACYSLPERATIPEWRLMVAGAEQRRNAAVSYYHRRSVRLLFLGVLAAVLTYLLALFFFRSRSRQTN